MDITTAVEIFGQGGGLIFVLAYMFYNTHKERLKIKKDKNKKLEEIQFRKDLKEQFKEDEKIHNDILKYLKIASEKYNEEINESQLRIITNSILSCSENAIKEYILRIINENHIIGQEREVKAKIKTYITNRYHKDSLMLKEFRFNNIHLSKSLNPEWKDYVVDILTELVLNQKGEKSVISTLENAFESFRYELLDSAL